MVNKCAAYGCNTGLTSHETHSKIATFHFPLKKEELLKKWTQFVNRKDWKPSSCSILCENHFKEEFITRGKRNTLKWNLDPVPTIHSRIALKRPSLLPNVPDLRKPPKVRIVQPDQMPEFHSNDLIHSIEDLDPIKHCPPGYEFKKCTNSVLFYRTVLDKDTEFPTISECIKIDANLHVQLQYNGKLIPLPKWFVQGRSAKLTHFSMLENFPAYISNEAERHPFPILDELRRRAHHKPKGRPPYSAEVIRYSLLLRYTSPQAYKLLQEKFPLPSFSLLQKLHKGGVESMKAASMLLKEGLISSDIILMADEMYLQQGAQFHGGEFVGANTEGQLYKGIFVFLIVGLKESVPIVVRASPETTINGHWISEELLQCLQDLREAGFSVRGVVTDNHSANVAAFKILLDKYDGDKKYYFTLPGSLNKTYVFFDTVHLLKNVRNNLLNGKKFVFPEFDFHVSGTNISSPPGFITWHDIHMIYDKDQNIEGNLRKAPKLSYKSLHPQNNKQDVQLAIAIFDESTIAACHCYFPDRDDMPNFLKLVLTWWTIANSSQRFSSNPLSHAIVPGDDKIKFYQSFANWLEYWSSGSCNFCFTKQTVNALIWTLRSQALLFTELLDIDKYEYVIPRRLQSDPIENRFSQYRQMSGGRFLVSLREVNSSERILVSRSLLKAGINIWEDEEESATEELQGDFLQELQLREDEIISLSLSESARDVAEVVAGYVATKLHCRFHCEKCEDVMVQHKKSDNTNKYFDALSRGGLTVPSSNLLEFVCSSFAILDFAETVIKSTSVRKLCEICLDIYAPESSYSCTEHEKLCRKFAIKMIVNIFHNNKQKHVCDNVRKEGVKEFKRRQRNKE